MKAREFLRTQRASQDTWPQRLLEILRAGEMSAEAAAEWLPEFQRRFRSRVPDFAGPGLFAALMRSEGLDAPALSLTILDHVFLALTRNQPRSDAAFVDYVRACVRSAAVTLRRQSMDSVGRAAARDNNVQVLSLDEQDALRETLAADNPDLTATVSDERVVQTLLAQAEADGQRENVEIVLRSTLEDTALADIARERGVSRQAVTKRYQRGVKYLAANSQAVFGMVAG
ncbi:MAG TPA: hypothetical protein DCZ72_01945 [Armatimonadetes bacterium]|nr:hypothetical protein [Armatimonadota bacterium]